MVKALGRTEYSGEVKWIAPADATADKEHSYCFRARRKFDADEIDESGKLLIAAESYYAVYLNGQQLGVGPARGTYDCDFLDTYDIGDLVRDGENDLAIKVLCNVVGTFTAVPAEPALFVCSGDLISDESWEVQKADDFRYDVPLYTLQNGFMNWRDWRKEPVGWQSFFDKSSWQSATVIGGESDIYSRKLFYRDVAMLATTEISPEAVSKVYEVDKIDLGQTNVAELMSEEKLFTCERDYSALAKGKAITIEPSADHDGVVLIVDFAHEFIGGFTLDIDAPAGTVLDMGYQEKIENGRLNLNPSIYDMADRFILADGRQQVSNPLHYRGGRFVQLAIRNFNESVCIHDFKIIDRRYPITKSAEFSCDSADYTEIWRRGFNTMSACAVDTFLDCPWREMSFWVNDFVVINMFWLKLIGDNNLIRRSLGLALSNRDDRGYAHGVCPDGKGNNMLFATNFFLPMTLRDTMRHSGDYQLVADMIDELGDVIECCESTLDDRGLMLVPERCWNFVDWSYHFVDKPLDGKNACVVNLFYVHALLAMAQLYQRSDAEKSRAYADKARRTMKAVEKHFWSAEHECFLEWIDADDAEPVLSGKLVPSLALLTGILSPEIQAVVVRDLADLDKNGFLPELYMLHFYFQALAKIDRHDVIYGLIEKYWSPMLETDCPTIWEANVYEHGKDAYDNAGSLCHAFSLTPIYCFQEYVLGVSPVSDGFDTFSFKPIAGKLKEAKGSVITPHGEIRVAWVRDGDMLKATISVPANTTCLLADGRELSAGEHSIELV